MLHTSARDGVLASAAMGAAVASKLLEVAAARSEGEEGGVDSGLGAIEKGGWRKGQNEGLADGSAGRWLRERWPKACSQERERFGGERDER